MGRMKRKMKKITASLTAVAIVLATVFAFLSNRVLPVNAATRIQDVAVDSLNSSVTAGYSPLEFWDSFPINFKGIIVGDNPFRKIFILYNDIGKFLPFCGLFYNDRIMDRIPYVIYRRIRPLFDGGLWFLLFRDKRYAVILPFRIIAAAYSRRIDQFRLSGVFQYFGTVCHHKSTEDF